MDGLDDQADAVVEGIIDQLFNNNNNNTDGDNEVVTIKHSSRDSLMLRITTALKDPNLIQNFNTKKLIFRGGISMNGLRWLEEALLMANNDMIISTKLEELEFVGLQNKLTLEGVLLLTRRLGIPKLSLTTYGSRSQTSRIDRDLLAHTIRSGLVLNINNIENHNKEDETTLSSSSSSPKMKLESLALTGYPLGSKGIEIVFEALRNDYSDCLKTLKLIDCDLRSDCNVCIANFIRSNPKIAYMDLSHNRHYPGGSSMQREMTIKSLVKRGLIYNLNLLELKLLENGSIPNQQRSQPSSSSSSPQLQQRVQRTILPPTTPRVNNNKKPSSTNKKKKKSSLIDRQLNINRFCKRLIKINKGGGGESNNEKERKKSDDGEGDNQTQPQQRQKHIWDPMSIHPHTYSHILAHVSSKPSALYLFIQENIPTLFPLN